MLYVSAVANIRPHCCRWPCVCDGRHKTVNDHADSRVRIIVGAFGIASAAGRVCFVSAKLASALAILSKRRGARTSTFIVLYPPYGPRCDATLSYLSSFVASLGRVLSRTLDRARHEDSTGFCSSGCFNL